MEYDVTIGIEIHCQLKTDTKMFSGAPTSFGRKANTCVNEIDLGMPGVLPEVNREAVKKAAPNVKENKRRDGSYAYYLSEPVRDNDAKGVGPFIWASLEYESLK